MEIGQVKWFNGKAGFGFVTVEGKDVFVHHSGLKVGNDQFRYLVEGEYVELKVSKTGEKYQGTEVTGIKGGKLMCEVRSEGNESTTKYKEGKVREERKPREERKGRKETVVDQMVQVHKPKVELL
jgi:CspA family cold shock protein